MSERSSDGRPVVSQMGHTVVYMEIGIPSLHLYMVYRGGGGSDMMCCMRKGMKHHLSLKQLQREP